MFFLLFFALLIYFLSFFPFVMEKDKKLVLMQKQMNLTSKNLEHPFAGRNTQHLVKSKFDLGCSDDPFAPAYSATQIGQEQRPALVSKSIGKIIKMSEMGKSARFVLIYLDR